MSHRKKLTLLTLFVLLALALAACGGGTAGGGEGGGANGGEEAASTVGDAAAGKALFEQSMLGSQPGCITCHSLEPDAVIVGPSLAGIGSRAATRVEGMSAEEYIRQSIVEPDAYVVEGFDPGVMVQVFGEELSEQQINDLVAYLLTLK